MFKVFILSSLNIFSIFLSFFSFFPYPFPSGMNEILGPIYYLFAIDQDKEVVGMCAMCLYVLCVCMYML